MLYICTLHHVYEYINSTRVDEGRAEIFSRSKCKARTVVGRGEKSLLCDPESELRLGGRGYKGKDNKWDGKKKNLVRQSIPCCGIYAARCFCAYIYLFMQRLLHNVKDLALPLQLYHQQYEVVP